MLDDTDLIDRPTGALIAAEKVKGTDVYDASGEKLGSIDSIMIDKQSGEVAYVVMSFGGLLGVGEKFHPLPWDVLNYDTERNGYRVDLDRDRIDGAPNFSRDEVDTLDYDREGAGINSYYAPHRRTGDTGDTGSSGGSFGGAGDDHGHSYATTGQHASDAPAGSRADDGVTHGTGSDANDGKGDRPVGFYSTQAQAQRSNDIGAVVQGTPDPRHPISTADVATPGSRDSETTTEAPGFYSPEQQAARAPIDPEYLRTDNGGPTSAPANPDGTHRR